MVDERFYGLALPRIRPQNGSQFRSRKRAAGSRPPRYLIRDRDGAYGEVFIRRVRSMGIRDRPTSPRSPWQNACAERLIGSIRRECLDHVVVLGERHSGNIRRVITQEGPPPLAWRSSPFDHVLGDA